MIATVSSLVWLLARNKNWGGYSRNAGHNAIRLSGEALGEKNKASMEVVRALRKKVIGRKAKTKTWAIQPMTFGSAPEAENDVPSYK